MRLSYRPRNVLHLGRGVTRLPSLFILAAGVQMMLPLAVVVASILAVKPAGLDPYLPILREASASHQRCPEGVACD